MLEVLYHHGGAWISPAAVTATNVEFFCLFVCPSRFRGTLASAKLIRWH